MKVIFLALAILGFSEWASAGNPCIFAGTTVKCLKQNLDMNGQVSILSGTTDPSASATSAPIGSMYLNTSSGSIYKKNDAGSTTNWTTITNQSYDSVRVLQNVSLAASVATNALTIALKTKAGSDPSGGSPVSVSFRNATAGTGTYTTPSVTAALSITVPSTATLGHTSAVNQYVWVYLLNDAGTVDICVSGVDVFFDSTLASATQISSGATSGSVLYCASAHTGSKPIRMIGRALVNETTAGTWAAAPTELAVGVIPTRTTTDEATFTPTYTGSGGGAAPVAGTATTTAVWYREGRRMVVRYIVKQTALGSSVTGTGATLILVPNSKTADTNYVQTAGGTTATIGIGLQIGAATSYNGGANSFYGDVLLYDTTHLCVYLNQPTVTSGYWGQAVNGFAANGVMQTSFEARFPIVGWSEYGP